MVRYLWMCRESDQDVTGLEQVPIEWFGANQRRLENKQCSNEASSAGSDVRRKEPQRLTMGTRMPFMGGELLLYFFSYSEK